MDTIVIKLKNALDLDQQKKLPQAYLEYISCLEEITKVIKNPNQNLTKLFGISKQCLERIETIHSQMNEKDLSQFEQPKMNYKDFKKIAEEQAIQKMKEEKRKEQELIENERKKRESEQESEQYVQKLKLEWSKFQWKHKDNLTDFIDTNFKYESMEKVILFNVIYRVCYGTI